MPPLLAGPDVPKRRLEFMRQDSYQVRQVSVRRRFQDDALSVLKSLLLVGITTIALLIAEQFFSLRHLILVYLVPVVIAATNLGMVPAVIAVIASGAATVFFFYPPIYSFLIEDPQHVVELLLYWAFGDQSQATSRSRTSPRN
jgi:two-component system sensor histidine kinase KdpD